MCCVLIIIAIVFVVICYVVNEKRAEQERMERRERERQHENLIKERHDKNIYSGTAYDHYIAPTGDYKHTFGGDNDGIHLWCTHHNEGKVCAVCINRRESKIGSSYEYGPNDAKHCASELLGLY